MIRTFKILFSQLVVCFLVFACAQRVPLTGGIKDEVAPIIVSSTPQNYSTNFLSSEIRVSFDEFVQLLSEKTEVVISPPIFPSPTMTVNGKTLSLKKLDSLKANTTYSINFGKAVQDITESNPLDSNLFVFSTGDVIDTLTADGSVKDAFTKEPIINSWVMLYEQSVFTDSSLYKTLPSYITKTKNTGGFTFNNLKEGQYQLLSLKEENNNKKYDNPSEEVAFLSKAITVPDTNFFELQMFKELVEPKLALLSFKSTNYACLSLIFSKAVTKIELPKVDSTAYYVLQKEASDSAQLIFTDTVLLQSLDSTMLILSFDDIQDTIRVPSLTSTVAPPVNIKSKTSTYKPTAALSLTLNTPLLSILQDSIQIMSSDSVIIPIKTFINPENPTKLDFEANTEPLNTYTIQFLPSALTSVYKQINRDTLLYTFSVDDDKNFANLTWVIPDSSNKIIQLLGTNDKVIEEKLMGSDTLATFEVVLQGSYRLRLIFDENYNDKWDAGNLLKQKQAERVVYYADPIELQGGFDQENKWIIKEDE